MSDLVAVTGASGHIGGVLVRALLARGVRPRVLVHHDTRAVDGLDVEVHHGDVTDAAAMRAFVDGADVVFHCAAVISIVGDADGRVRHTNVVGADTVARAALDAGVRRYVHFSSVHAFEQHRPDGVIDEDGPRCADSAPAYDRSKRDGERAVRAAIDDGLDGVIVHPTAVIGPADFRPSHQGELLLWLAWRRLPALIPGGYDWVDVRDVADGALAAAERGRTGTSYLLAGRWHSAVELGQIAESITGVRTPRFVVPSGLARAVAPVAVWGARRLGIRALFTPEAVLALTASHEVRNPKAQAELGHTARPLEHTVRDAYRWFAEQGRLPEHVAARLR